MKIRIDSPSGYCSLEDLDFPIIVEASEISENDVVHVKAPVLHAVICAGMLDEDYIFLPDEYTVVEEGESLSDLYGDGAREILEEVAELAAKDLGEKVFGADRKALLLQLVVNYADAISNCCYASERGSAEFLKACIAKEERLLKEITKMIEEGV